MKRMLIALNTIALAFVFGGAFAQAPAPAAKAPNPAVQADRKELQADRE